MNRLVRSAGLAAVFAGAALLCACASTPKDPYAQATRPVRECSTGSRICTADEGAGRTTTLKRMPVEGGDVIGTLKQLPSVTVR
ncbi:MAG TPA: hypothetical protein VJ011_06700 [Steroidobacteraceae bacterium]|nr:hypothetical protein [Steroidobacteraceae bacterium]